MPLVALSSDIFATPHTTLSTVHTGGWIRPSVPTRMNITPKYVGSIPALSAIGTVMDLTPTILVMGPVLMPIALKAGIDPTYFGVMFILVGTLGLIHPPVCTVLNVVCGVAKISLESATKGIWPFLLTYIVLILIFIIFPGIIIAPVAWMR